MYNLPGLNLPKTLDTSTSDIIQTFFIPALSIAKQYDRGVGYFSSGWLRINAKGMVKFAANGGQARWVTSPILNEADWKALHKGDAARYDPILRAALTRNINELAQMLETDTLSALAWMIADEILTFKLALPHNKLQGGEFHDKFGIFTDAEGHQISFNGSYNESVQGTRNYESIKIFPSWMEDFSPLVRADAQRFEKLWANQDPNVRIFGLPEAAREKIINLRSQERPYRPPDLIKEEKKHYVVSINLKEPAMPENIVLRDYQKKAIKAWFDNQCRGILEMATGTGKTITALGALAELCLSQSRLVIVMACPYKHLVSQWADEFARFGYKYLKVFGLAKAKQNELANQFLNFSAGYINNLVILTTHDTFANPKFWQIIEQKSFPLLLIADEVHELGAKKRQLGLREAYIYRLGLSATPKRWLDDMGTDLLFSYFDKTVFSFSLADAIPKYLTPYDYFPYFVELQDDELEKYYELTSKIVRRANVTQSDEDEIPDLYLIERQKIIINAKAKFDPFENIIRDLQNTTHTLVYCSPQQINHTQNLLNGHNIIQHRFTGQESLKERERLLSSFAKGQHKMLVAMKCLDQGVDVPATRNAIILASSGNPKQFIQRRGRVLRKSPGKEKAAIYDIIVVPTLNNNQLDKATFNMERKILKRELIRYNEFASLALNSTYALNKIGPIKRQYRL